MFVVPVMLYAAWLLWSRSQAGSTGGNVHLYNLLLGAELGPQFAGERRGGIARAQLSLARQRLGSRDRGGRTRVSRLEVVAGEYPEVAVGDDGGAGNPVADGRCGLRSRRFACPRNPSTCSRPRSPCCWSPWRPARGVRLRRRGMTILYAATAISLATNIALLRDGSREFRATTTVNRTSLTVGRACRCGRSPTSRIRGELPRRRAAIRIAGVFSGRPAHSERGHSGSGRRQSRREARAPTPTGLRARHPVPIGRGETRATGELRAAPGRRGAEGQWVSRTVTPAPVRERVHRPGRSAPVRWVDDAPDPS